MAMKDVKRIAKDDVNGFRISTIYELGQYQTCIFSDDYERYPAALDTVEVFDLDEAMKLHDEAVNLIRDGKFEIVTKHSLVMDRKEHTPQFCPTCGEFY